MKKDGTFEVGDVVKDSFGRHGPSVVYRSEENYLNGWSYASMDLDTGEVWLSDDYDTVRAKGVRRSAEVIRAVDVLKAARAALAQAEDFFEKGLREEEEEVACDWSSVEEHGYEEEENEK